MNVLATGAFAWTADALQTVEQMGHCVIFMQQEKDALPCDPEWVEGVICNGLFVHHAIEQFKNLRYIQLTSAGFDRVPMDYIQAHGIQIHNARGVYSIPMAEFVIGGVLQLYKQSRFFSDNQAAHRWEKHRGLLELYGKTVCIVGCGSVGTECAKRFGAFGCHVVGVNRTPKTNECFEKMLPLAQLDAVLADSDVVVLTLPLTEQTHHLIHAERLAAMKPGAVLVNIARGGVVDTDALTEALAANKIGGAVLDVFETEPLPADSPLWELENVIVTPHNSFVGEGNWQRLQKAIISNIIGR